MHTHLDRIYLYDGEIRLFSHEDFLNGTLYGYHLRWYSHDSDFVLHKTEDGFGSEAAARSHGLSQLEQLFRQPR